MWFNGLISLDFFVSNARQMLDALVERLGFLRPDVELPIVGRQADGFYLPPNSGAEIAWFRPSAWTADHLQIMAMRTLSTEERRAAVDTPLNSIHGILTGVLASQGNRPIKAHQVTPVMADEDLIDLVRFWDRKGVPYHLTRPTELVPMPALFPGWSGDPPRFDASKVLLPWEFASPALLDLATDIDRDHWLEMLQAGWRDVHMPTAADGDPPAGALVSVIGRSFLVEDLDGALDLLRANMNLDSNAENVSQKEFPTYKSALFAPSARADGIGTAAALELIEPTSDDYRAASYFAMFGPGPFAHRLGTNSLDACCGGLEERGTRWSVVDAESGADRILIDPAQLCGAYVEIQET